MENEKKECVREREGGREGERIERVCEREKEKK